MREGVGVEGAAWDLGGEAVWMGSCTLHLLLPQPLQTLQRQQQQLLLQRMLPPNPLPLFVSPPCSSQTPPLPPQPLPPWCSHPPSTPISWVAIVVVVVVAPSPLPLAPSPPCSLGRPPLRGEGGAWVKSAATPCPAPRPCWRRQQRRRRRRRRRSARPPCGAEPWACSSGRGGRRMMAWGTNPTHSSPLTPTWWHL